MDYFKMMAKNILPRKISSPMGAGGKDMVLLIGLYKKLIVPL